MMLLGDNIVLNILIGEGMFVLNEFEIIDFDDSIDVGGVGVGFGGIGGKFEV